MNTPNVAESALPEDRSTESCCPCLDAMPNKFRQVLAHSTGDDQQAQPQFEDQVSRRPGTAEQESWVTGGAASLSKQYLQKYMPWGLRGAARELKIAHAPRANLRGLHAR